MCSLTGISIREHDCPMWQNDYKTYVVSFFNDHIFTTVTSNPDRVSEWISGVKLFPRQRLIVGLDIKGRAPNGVALLQICVGGRCLIYQISHSPKIPKSLKDFFLEYANIMIGKYVKLDLEKLASDYGIGDDAFYVDLGYLAANWHYMDDKKMDLGLKRMAKDVLGRDVEKPRHVKSSEWTNWCLSADQVQYACVNAFVSMEMGRLLLPYPYY